MIDLENICSQAVETAKKAGFYIREQRKKFTQDKVKIKGRNNFVTHVDETSEKIIVEDLMKILPESGFITEEESIKTERKEYTWIIDPLDGTTNFIHALPPYAVSIALEHQGEIIVGVVYEIGSDECFYAWKNGKAWLNGQEIQVSQAKSVKDSLVVTGFPTDTYYHMEGMKKSLDYITQNTHGIRRLGSAATDLVYIACGRMEVFYEYSLNAWDIAAGVLIVKEAGGKVGDFGGGNNFLFGKEIVASNPYIFDEFIALTKGFFLKK